MKNAEIFKQFAEGIMPELMAVSKGFAPTISYEVSDNHLEITASPYIRVLIDGRAPTRNGAPKGSPTLQQAILAWISRHSITGKADKKGRVPTAEQLSWAISKSIHLHGTKLYQDIRHGASRNNIFDTILTDARIENLLTLLENKFRVEIKNIVND